MTRSTPEQRAALAAWDKAVAGHRWWLATVHLNDEAQRYDAAYMSNLADAEWVRRAREAELTACLSDPDMTAFGY